MLKQALNLTRFKLFLPWTATLLFHGFIFFIIATAKLPPLSDQTFVSRQRLFEDNKKYFPDPDGVFSLFKPYAPEKGSLSFIMDFPYNPYGTNIAQVFSAQNYFAPLILNPHPQEKQAFFFCSSNQIAAVRLQETGYKIRALLADGKGLAEKPV